MRDRRVLLAGVAVVVAGTGIGGIAVANGARDQLRADLRGTNELPATDLDARGRARVELDVVGGELCFSIRFDHVGTPNRGHIHVGGSDVNGGIVVPLFELATMPADARHDALEEGRLDDCVPADPTVLAAIAADPDGYYVNLHNARFPAGAARGQLD
jgi:CHRD domain-containing protein